MYFVTCWANKRGLFQVGVENELDREVWEFLEFFIYNFWQLLMCGENTIISTFNDRETNVIISLLVKSCNSSYKQKSFIVCFYIKNTHCNSFNGSFSGNAHLGYDLHPDFWRTL